MITTKPPSDFAPGLDRAFDQDLEEQTRLPVDVEGSIPDYVRGSLYLNGPAKFRFRDGFRYEHWLDGDGMVCAVHFDDDGVRCESRYVQGRKFLNESSEKAGRRGPIYRAFGSAFPGDKLKRGVATESPYNVSVFPYRGKLLAFGEQSLPMALDPDSLCTLTPGRTYDFDRSLNDALPFSAHPKIDESGELLNFGVFFHPTEPSLIYYRIDSSGRLACRKKIAIDYPCSIHDFATSANYVVFYLSPYILDTDSLVSKGRSTMDALCWLPELGSEILVLCRETGEEVFRKRIEGKYCLHTINAFESEGKLFFDLIEFESPIYDQYRPLPRLFETVPPGRPVRFSIDIGADMVNRVAEINYDHSPDFPCIEPKADGCDYERFWMLGISTSGESGRKFFDRLVEARWASPRCVRQWSPRPGRFLGGEPTFVADPEKRDGGAVIAPIYDTDDRRSHFAIFQASDISEGPIARLYLSKPIHLGFHSSFRSAVCDLRT